MKLYRITNPGGGVWGRFLKISQSGRVDVGLKSNRQDRQPIGTLPDATIGANIIPP
jgi:hypothetical protein